ncbi:TIGR01777 family oxidoreductase [Alteromonas halophila]|uniref:Epimerase n=1 Tax=Alteromonas halophila TaxID=516698 RepID=A0A918JD70_9ALTE|nr:TIGR01777 family oxidoreductase [Alteromonas halophila]GGW75311.1 epimerase [Alteromonas halophila]
MNILITGGSGFIGRYLIDALKDSHQITVLTRSPAATAKVLPASCDLIASLDDIKDFSRFDAVINLAGEPIADKRWTPLQKQRICHSRWDITAQLVNRINGCASPPDVFLSGSAIGYYGRQGDRTVTEEEHQVHDEFTHQLCAKWERLAEDVNTEKTRLCLLRTGVVLEKDEGALARMALPFRFGLGGKIGNGKQYLSWIHIDDMVSAILFLLHHDACNGAFNMTAPEPVTNKTFSESLATALHRPCLFTVPAFSMKLIMGEAADMILTGQKVLPKKLEEAGFTFKYTMPQQALDAIYQ